MRINLAQSLAEWIHYGDSDKQGKPKIDHVLRVVDRVIKLTHEQRLAAILHDTVEDCYPIMRPAELLLSIEFIFGHGVLRLVTALTRLKGANETYSEYIKRLSQNRDAIPIKLADLADNMDLSRGTFEGQEGLLERYRKAKEYLESIVVYSGN